MMPSLNLFRQGIAEGEARSQMSHIGIALLVFFAAISLWLWQTIGPRWVLALPMLAGLYCAFALRVAAQWQKAAVLRLGRYRGLRGPGLFHIIPVIDSVSLFVDQRVRVTDVRAETALTRDTVPVSVDAIVFWVVWNPEKAILEVANFTEAVTLSAQTALRESIGRHELSQMITDREALGHELQKILDEKTNPWGVTVQSVEIRDVQLPKELEDAMSRRAQAERERQARVILGTAETEISEKFAQAALAYQNNPIALHLRAMNMLYEALKEKGSMVIVPSSAVETMGLGGLLGTASLAGLTPVQPLPSAAA
jgi:regulator of protease activity HflC (stomatin/prohibitin superfamily)